MCVYDQISLKYDISAVFINPIDILRFFIVSQIAQYLILIVNLISRLSSRHLFSTRAARGETASEWRVKRSLCSNTLVISLLIVPEALVKGHSLIGPVPRSSSKNYVPASAAKAPTGPVGLAARCSHARMHTHVTDTRANNIPARMNGAAERAGGRRREEQAYLSRSRTLRSNYHLPHFPTSPEQTSRIPMR